MEELHKQSVDAFITTLCSQPLPTFEALAWRMWYNIGWELSSIKYVFLAINRAADKQVYKYHSDNEKIKAAIVTHQKYLRSQLSK